MIRRPPRVTLPDTLVPYTTRCRTGLPAGAEVFRCGARQRRQGRSCRPLRRQGSGWRDDLLGVARGRSGHRQEARLRRGCQGPGGEASRALHEPEEDHLQAQARSEEHTSELQSLMRISYAVFCLKKKKKNNKYKNTK